MTLRRCRAQAPLREGPEMAVCPDCDGIGDVRNKRTGVCETCPRCWGRGEIEIEKVEDENAQQQG